MRILVMESINALPDRVLLVQEARRRALTEPAASTFSLTKRRCCSWHDGVDVIAPCLPQLRRQQCGKRFRRHVTTKLSEFCRRPYGSARGSLNWTRLSEQKFRVDKWSLCRVRPPRGAEEDRSRLDPGCGRQGSNGGDSDCRSRDIGRSSCGPR